MEEEIVRDIGIYAASVAVTDYHNTRSFIKWKMVHIDEQEYRKLYQQPALSDLEEGDWGDYSHFDDLKGGEEDAI
jgi:hypothetical protein